ncbi:MAG: TRAP transporter small permease [Firmicutes bacterium]|jgi:TRAP-type C4-dicarboxylate transport system permease small subunit|nr:TRAP transporter small permease [Bacillota bacterium]
MRQTLGTARKISIRLSLGLAAIMLVAMVLSVFLQVVFRYALAQPLSWAEELARFLFVWISMLSAAGGLGGSMRQGVDLVTRRLPVKARAVIGILVRLGTVLFCSVLVMWGIELVKIVHYQTSPAMGVPMSWVYSAVPVAAGLMVFMLVTDALVADGRGE